MNKTIERIVPYICGLVVVVIIILLKVESVHFEKLDLIISSLITVCVTIIGFFITVITILISLVNSDVMKFIHDKDGDKLLTNYFISPILFGFAIIIYCFYLAFAAGESNTIYLFQIYISAFLIIVFLVASIRIGIILLYILRMVPKQYSNSMKIVKSDPNKAFMNSKEESI